MENYDSGNNISIRVNDFFYFIMVLSGYHLFVVDDTVPIVSVNKKVTNSELGKLSKVALKKCRVIAPHVDSFFFNRDRLAECEKKWLSENLSSLGFKNKKNFYQSMMLCNIREKNGFLTLRPTLHKKLETWTGDGFTEDDYIVLPDSVSDEELGEAIKEVLSRCRSVVK
ncbi:MULTISPECIES: contact-dependent growth inhibition system immunity protein [Providencia]|uniref:contact-dependent growth inhibition system immunity protein n=1 Tax=Providencia TaxID=586 RepID=UPI0015EBA4C1|nr:MULTISPECIES: contact-dependent growth inhibition system immunity protein [Providencia]QLQ66409.1 CdiI family contact-dependent growth inhibition immunity protein [Providencia rettgeri]URR23522.1 contact-dependent growth inhibition system immunity protein [Providencia rettgeri]